ncbi:MAG: hypothetical protein LBD59_02485 [Prevotellaceae bacterium]|nr:hypothetical protein [Prevotellaceae bacterium]
MRKKHLRKMEKLSKKRKITVHNFDTAKTMGVALLSTDRAQLRSVLDNLVKKYNLKITFAIYYPEKKLPENVGVYTDNVLFADSECNWFGKPANRAIDKFTNCEFNILIDLSEKACFPLQCLVAASKANFKIGNSHNAQLYDFMLLGNSSSENFIMNIETYLKKINCNE